MAQDFTYLMRIRYSECDAQGVVFNAKYVEYIDVAITEFQRVLWGGYHEVSNNGLETQVVNVNINWQASARFDDILAIRMKPLRLGNTSFTLQVDFSNHDTQQALASAEITYVLVQSPEYTKTPIPDNMRKALEQGAPDVVINHAGNVSGN